MAGNAAAKAPLGYLWVKEENSENMLHYKSRSSCISRFDVNVLRNMIMNPTFPILFPQSVSVNTVKYSILITPAKLSKIRSLHGAKNIKKLQSA